MTDHIGTLKCPKCHRSDGFRYVELIEVRRRVRVEGGKILVATHGIPTSDALSLREPHFQCDRCQHRWPVPEWVQKRIEPRVPCMHGVVGCCPRCTKSLRQHAKSANFGFEPIQGGPLSDVPAVLRELVKLPSARGIPVPSAPGKLALPHTMAETPRGRAIFPALPPAPPEPPMDKPYLPAEAKALRCFWCGVLGSKVALTNGLCKPCEGTRSGKCGCSVLDHRPDPQRGVVYCQNHPDLLWDLP